MSAVMQNKMIFCLAALGFLLIPTPARSASLNEGGPKTTAESTSAQANPVETKPAAGLEPDENKRTSAGRGSSSGQDDALNWLTVQGVQVCLNVGNELNLPGSLVVVVDAETPRRVRLRKISKPKAHLGLVLNGTFMSGTSPQEVSISQGNKHDICPALLEALNKNQGDSTDKSKQVLYLFRLSFNPTYRAEWKTVLDGNEGNGITVSVGFDDGEVMDSTQTINIKPSRLEWAASIGVAAVLMACFIFLVKRSHMLTEPPNHHSYSLGRTQMAWWTVLTVWGFFFIYEYTGTVNLTTSVVVLMGISSATALGAVLIDKRKDDNQDKLWTSSGTEAQGSVKIDKRDYFLAKLLSDPGDPLNDYSLHRVQIFCWNLVMSYVFLRSVVISYTMPEFDNTLLGLMGLSSAAYLGFKREEKPAVTTTTSLATGPAAQG